MDIRVELFGQLQVGRDKLTVVAIKAPVSVADLAACLGLDPDAIGLVVIDGVQSELTDVLNKSCKLSLFPYVSGG